MTRAKKAIGKILDGNQSIRFPDFQAVLEAFGFRLDRMRGSHHIYIHPNVGRPLSVQPRRGDAKPYQVRQFLDMVEEFGLNMDGKK